MKHVLAITYKSKEDAIISGGCRQTIRPHRGIRVDDEILFHGWIDRPYRSGWSWRKRVTVKEVINIKINNVGVFILQNLHFEFYKWDSDKVNEHAKLDYIDPPTGLELRKVLLKFSKGEKWFDIIRW